MWRTARVVSFLPLPLLVAVLWLFPVDDAKDPALRFDSGHAFGLLTALQNKFPERVPGGPAHTGARAFIETELTRLGFAPTRKEFRVAGKAYVNVLAQCAGKRSETIVLGAHYDTVVGSPGAADNGAAVATLLALAKAFAPETRGKACSGDLPFRLVFAFWDGEEAQLLGSRNYVTNLPEAERRRLVAAIAFDLLGWKDGRTVVHTLSREDRSGVRRLAPEWLVSDLLSAARRAGEALDVGDPFFTLLYQVAVRLSEVPLGSDDTPFLVAGVASAFISDSSLSRFYPHYHLASDTTAQVDAARLAAAGRVTEAFVRSLTRPPSPDDASNQSYVALGGRTFGLAVLWALIVAAAIPRLFLHARSLAFDETTTREVYDAVFVVLALLPSAISPAFFALVVTPIVYLSALPQGWFLTAATSPVALSPLGFLVAAKVKLGAAFALAIPWWALAAWSLWLGLFVFRRRR